jgi:hypothetical protein
MNLIVDPDRFEEHGGEGLTGIFIRAQHPKTEKWLSVDIAVLNKPSLLAWLRSRDGDNPWAEDVVGILLGHGHLHDIPRL